MRPALFALLVCLLLLVVVQAVPRGSSSGPTSVTAAWTRLIEAYQSVQGADRLGASQQDLVQFSSDLNTALGDYGTATQLSAEENQTGSEYYADLSYQISTNVETRAVALQAEAESQKTNGQVAAYLAAVLAGALSALLVMEYHEIRNFVKRRKLLRMRIGRRTASAP